MLDDEVAALQSSIPQLGGSTPLTMLRTLFATVDQVASDAQSSPQRGLTGPYTVLRTLFATLDQEVAFAVDRVRKNRLTQPDPTSLETRINERLAAYEEISQTLSAAQAGAIERSKDELRWILQQLQQGR
jgi:hypothetical protein